MGYNRKIKHHYRVYNLQSVEMGKKANEAVNEDLPEVAFLIFR